MYICWNFTHLLDFTMYFTELYIYGLVFATYMGNICVAGKTLLLLVQNEHNGQTVRLAGKNGTLGDPAGLLAATTFLCGRRTSTTEQTAVLGTSSYSCSHYATYLDCTA